MLEFTTRGMDYYDKKKSYESGNIVPLGTECFKAGSWLERTEPVIVNHENQKIISMLWNDGYYLNKEDAIRCENQSVSDYFNWITSPISK